MLKLEHVKKNYKDFQLDCSLEVKKGCVTGLIGKNGAGKTTAFKAILGLIRTDGGEITLFDKSLEMIGVKEKQDLGVVLSDSGFSGYMKVKDYVPFLEAMYPRFDKEGFLNSCKEFRIPLDKKIKEFSTGMKRKLHLITALSHDAKFLILDEPSAALDLPCKEVIHEQLLAFAKKGGIILFTTHEETEFSLCHTLYILKDGTLHTAPDTQDMHLLIQHF